MNKRHTLARVSALPLLFGMLAACGDDTQKQTAPFVIIDEIDQGDTTDMKTTEDMGPGEVDQGPGDPTVAAEPRGNVFLNDPTKDERKTTEVVLPKPDNEEGRLTNDVVNVLNCINELGEPLSFQGFMIGNLCKEVQTALPAQDGHYTHIMPPAQYTDPSDVFAEVQMYYHVNQVHDYFTKELGLTGIERIDALPNVQIYTNETAAQFLGRPPGWFPFDNAAFMFPESFEQAGLPPREKGAIVFGQGEVADFSYDASVIYHEYTHSIVGTNRLQGVFPDSYGLNNTPGAINEGLADYFATTMLEDPLLGRYGLAAFGADKARDLSKNYTCPASLSSEIHDDGRIMGAMLWSARQELGKAVTDPIVMRALNSSIAATGFDQFTQLVLAEANREGGRTAEVFNQKAQEFGLNGCERAKEFTTWQATSVPVSLVGRQELQGANFADGVPGYFQFWTQQNAEGKLPRLSWTIQSGGFGFGGGQLSGINLAVALGKPVVLNGTTVRSDAKFTNIASQSGQQSTVSQSVTLAADCFTGEGGKAYLMLLNPNNSGVSVVSTSITYVDDTPEAGALSCAQN